ncbi:MAG: hypothetical protein LBP56_08055 [Odoribacteraceae bacterium]|jgi:hypothetical protein|nr:hypothetical protein [Odoribacteraceae bacterium]
MITRENHELYALDYLEGRLDDETREAFEAVLRANPATRETLEGVSRARLVAPRVAFRGKEALKRFEDDRVDYLLVAAAEGVLTAGEQAAVEALPDREAFEAGVAAYARTRVKPDPLTRFPGKARARRGPWRRWWIAGAAAAAVLCWIARPEAGLPGGRVASPVPLAAGTRIVVAEKRAAAAPKASAARPVARPALPAPPRVALPPLIVAKRESRELATTGISPQAMPDRLPARPAPPRAIEAAGEPAWWLAFTPFPVESLVLPVESLLKDNLVVDLLHAGKELAGRIEEKYLSLMALPRKERAPVTY